ncbi:hypothetical protein HMF7854_00405 [Sphingomonas ginkgonis]|uniref:Glycosyltransferase family 1 protein n=1 Tax=Sphingomonas ginkgonis TaxID=2315330 RepID=A0A429V6A1_9SPHN|nr:hypothetical protein [Sphingomonas ginkgonis]RST29459.1 hypothetical protein HMF7854_00405 [Sphingomonas ginkgonis]
MKSMRVLLLGELSGFHQELRPGLERAGLSVTSAHSRTAFPEYRSDIPLYRPPPSGGGTLTLLRDVASQLLHAREMTGFDVVQLITPKFFNWKLHEPMMRYLKRNNGALVVVNTACTSDYHRRVRELRYSPCAECQAHDLKSDCIYDRPDERRAEYVAWDLADRIVSTHFEYDWALADTPLRDKLANIPLPLDTARHRPTPMPPGPVRIWYGETRFGFKGGRFIRDALTRLANDPTVEIVQSPRLPFAHYLDFLGSVHIMIDQANSYGPGMNALYAMAKGKVVLTGAEAEQGHASPAINILPDGDDIYRHLTSLVGNRRALEERGKAAAEFIERVHSSDAVAQQYAEVYRSIV